MRTSSAKATAGCPWSSSVASTASSSRSTTGKRFGDLGTAEMREPHQLRQKNRTLKTEVDPGVAKDTALLKKPSVGP